MKPKVKSITAIYCEFRLIKCLKTRNNWSGRRFRYLVEYRKICDDHLMNMKTRLYRSICRTACNCAVSPHPARAVEEVHSVKCVS